MEVHSQGPGTLTRCYEAVKGFAAAAFNSIASAASWAGRHVVAAGSAAGVFISETASKIAEYVRPFFKELSTTVSKHPGLFATITVAAMGVGAALYALLCKATGTTPPQAQQQQPAPAPAATV